MAKYTGPVAFAHPPGTDGTQGEHYAVGDDDQADYSRPLFWDAEKGYYRDKKPDDPSHFEAYHVDHRDLVPEAGGEPVPVTDEEMAVVQKVLDEMRGE